MKINFFKKNHHNDANLTRPVLRSNLMEKISSDPFLDWVLVLVVGLFVFIALVVLDISVYLDSTDSLKSSPTQVGKPQKLPLDEKLLDKVLGEYEARASKHSTLMRSYTAPSDPSLP